MMVNNWEWFIYIVKENSTCNIKIGFGKTVRKRLSEIQVGNPRKLSIIYEEAFETQEEARKIEKLLHDLLAPRSLYGEWFEYRQSQDEMISSLKKEGMCKYLERYRNGWLSAPLNDDLKSILKQINLNIINGFHREEFEQLHIFADELYSLSRGILERLKTRRNILYGG
jgi:hypothetical protein